MKDLLPVSSVQGFEKRLRDEVRRRFPFDTTLTVHSTRHTFKSLSRMVAMPADISDEIDRHKRQQTLLCLMLMVIILTKY